MCYFYVYDRFIQELIMRTNIDLDDDLLAYVQAEGGHKTKREAVEAALKEYRRRLAMRALLNMAGKVEFAGTGAELRGKTESTAVLAQEPQVAGYASAMAPVPRVSAPRKARGK
jgi:Arc/MetJ family transcription regulator